MIVTGELSTFERKTFQVKAVRITSMNIEEIAEWTGGEYVRPGNGAQHVRIPAGKDYPRAYMGDWVTSLINEDGEEQNFRVYKEHTFLQAFRKIMDQAEKYAKVHSLLMKVSRAQDVATYHGEGSSDVLLLVEKTAREICNII